MSTLSLDLRAFADLAKNRIDELNRKAVMFAAQGLVLRSPVGNPDLWAENSQAAYIRETYNTFVDRLNETAAPGDKKVRRMSTKKLREKFPNKVGGGYVGGRFRNNWQFGYGEVNKATTETPDKSGQAALGRIQAAVDAVEAGGICYVTNSLPYAQRLENGWSKQAPSGMVKVTFAELPVQIEAYARSLG